jgi:hypothetical protein
MQSLISSHGEECSKCLSSLFRSSSSLSQILHLAHRHSVVFSVSKFADSEWVVQQLESNLKSTVKPTKNSSNDIIRQIMISMWQEKAAKNTIEVAKAMSSESLSRSATEIYLKEQEKRSKLFAKWSEDVSEEFDDLIFEIDSEKTVFNFEEKTGKLELRYEYFCTHINYMYSYK